MLSSVNRISDLFTFPDLLQNSFIPISRLLKVWSNFTKTKIKVNIHATFTQIPLVMERYRVVILQALIIAPHFG